MESFRDSNAICAYIDPESGARCVNTRAGHAKGHQRKTGAFMRTGGYIEEDGSITTALFVSMIEKYIGLLIQKFSTEGHSNQRVWRQLAVKEHRKNIERLRLEHTFPRAGRAEADDPFSTTSICYGCLFRHSEYLLPCGHTICETCVKVNSVATDAMKYTGLHTIEGCVICGTSIGPGWPFEVRLRPQLSGIRILSLDGGGVRGIVQLTVLQRLESVIGLGLPIGRFFDLIVGTSTGGLMALGLGIQEVSADSLGEEFKSICNVGFSGQRQNMGKIQSFLSWMSLNCVYFTQNLEEALEAHFRKKGNSKVFGLRNHCRVGVTTTVGSEAKLISNYQRGGSGSEKYLDSHLSLADAARCTSAAPLYFDPKLHNGDLCRDGGLKEGNPVQLAVTESKGIWGRASNYDMILSVGSGTAPQPPPDSQYSYLVKPKWLWKLFCTFLDKMNGEEEWVKFRQSGADRIVERASRLNVLFPEQQEPPFNDLAGMERMQFDANIFKYFEETPLKSPFSPIGGRSELSVLATLGDRLRATLFFLEVKSVDKSDGFIIIVKGMIRCRLGPKDAGFSKLLGMVSSFRVNQEIFNFNFTPLSLNYFDLDVEFSHESIDEAIRIDVNFGEKHWVAISGCPITIREIIEQWDPVGAQDVDTESEPESGSATPERTDMHMSPNVHPIASDTTPSGLGTRQPNVRKVESSALVHEMDSAAISNPGPSRSRNPASIIEISDDEESIGNLDIQTLRTDDASDYSWDASY
ncbi:hypothetical protein TWF481_000271 [Arthrobotrys musiformis]|uniref:PNPLA domain-containing protein n=1 Tax=Arthrobotrys musiformis TaxID=47236 RepID=A0AAV9WSX1_9PEZI